MSKKSIVIGALGTALLSSLLSNTSYKVNQVIDGDTFETTEHQFIRLADTNAPEKGLCGNTQAQEQLEKLLGNKQVFLKVIYKDSFDRLIAWVYTPQGFVNQAMVNSGWAVYEQKTAPLNQTLVQAKKTAREKGLGVYSLLCTQNTNPKCPIKGNSIRGQYHFPGCGQYNNTDVQLYLGDRWFCSESEAQKAGFTKGSDCFDQTFHPGQ